VVLAVTKAGKMLPSSVITKSESKMAREYPGNTLTIKDGIFMYQQPSKNMTSHIMIDYIKNVLAPCFPHDRKKLLIMDSFTGHKTRQVLDFCGELNFDVAMIPGGLTKDFQPLDISVNRSFKSKLKNLEISGLKKIGECIKMKDRVRELVKNVKQAGEMVSDQFILNGFNHLWKFLN